MQKKMKYIIPVLLLLVIIGSSGYLIYQAIAREAAQKEYNELLEQIILTSDEQSAVEEIQQQEPTQDSETQRFEYLVLDYAALEEMNDSFAGWLSIPALNLNYPIAQGSDNSYYLRHSFEKEYCISGSLFLDYGASSDWSDRNSFVFGHNMKDETMFGKLKYYLEDPSICEEDPYIYLYMEGEVRIYQIFAYYEVSSNSDQFRISLTDEDYDAYMTQAEELSEYESEVDLTERPNIITLSTCYGNNGTKQRVLVHGAFVGTEILP